MTGERTPLIQDKHYSGAEERPGQVSMDDIGNGALVELDFRQLTEGGTAHGLPHLARSVVTIPGEVMSDLATAWFKAHPEAAAEFTTA